MRGRRLGAVVIVSPVIGVIVIVAILGVVVGAALFAFHQHNRMFPKNWDRTGWEPRSSGGWFATKFTWLSGGRG
jgi:hypothetical protein